MAERGSIDRIVDAETFNLWVIGYTAGIREEQPAEKLEAMRKRQSRFFRSIFDDADYDPVLTLKLKESPWDEVPGSLQDRIKLQYEAAKVEGDKTIDTTIESDFIAFSLNSKYTKGFLDLYGETFVGFGLRLGLSNERERRGQWSISRIPASLPAKMDRLRREGELVGVSLDRAEDSLNERARASVMRVPANIAELRDVARFFVNSRSRAVFQSI